MEHQQVRFQPDFSFKLSAPKWWLLKTFRGILRRQTECWISYSLVCVVRLGAETTCQNFMHISKHWCQPFPFNIENLADVHSFINVEASHNVESIWENVEHCSRHTRAGSKSQCIRILYLKVKYLYLTCPSCIDPSSWLVLDLHWGCDLTCFSSIISK